ncbi:MAG TPA: hypothetical protein VKK81_18775 [Candidatus Binatia bacterium]|nr:hypothetical protein [Candidatus Binatia bacterium]
MNAYAIGNSISGSGTTSSSCTTSYTPPTNQTIDIQKPVVFILADTETNRLILTCTRNVRWSQCHALNPGNFSARMDKGHFEVQAMSDKGKEGWIKFDVVQQTTLSKPEPATSTAQTTPAQTASVPTAPVSIEAPESTSSGANPEFPKRWKSMTSGAVRVLRFEGEYIYAEQVVPEAAAKAGVFFLMEVKKDGEKYAGKISGRIVRPDGGASCPVTYPTELTSVTKERIEGRGFGPPDNAKIDWSTCTFSLPSSWRDFSWIPIR